MKGKRYFSFFCAFLVVVSYFFLAVFFGAGEDKAHVSEAEVPAAEQAFRVLDIEEGQDFILAAYRDNELKEEVLAFFQGITGSEEIAEVILSNASDNDISPALAFSLCAEESSYNPQAFNRNRNETVDRGLFQLNSATFPKLTVDDFYDLSENARYGISHLRWCLDTAGTEVAALAMYNAGETRVRSTGTPKSTLDYISRILKRQRKIEELFLAEYSHFVRTIDTETESAKTERKEPFRPNPLTPIGGRWKQ